MRAVVVLALIAAVVLADSEISFDFVSGENLTDAKADFKFRYQNAMMIPIPSDYIPIPLPTSIFLWTSVSVDASAADSKALANADALAGIAFPPNKGFFPVGIVGYGTGKAAAEAKFTDYKSMMNFIVKGEFKGDFDAGVVAMAGLYLQEFTSKGDAAGSPVFLTVADESCKPEAIKEDEIKGMTCTMTPKGTDAKITVTYVTSEKAGILKYGYTPVSPRSMEMIIKVDGFKLSDKKNHIRLVLGLLTASGKGEVEGNAKVIKNENKDDVYVAASEYAVIDDKRVQVDLSIKSGHEELGSVEAMLSATLGGSLDTQLVNVDFPAGEESFIYDPAAGSGSNVYLAGASTAALSLLAALVCAFLFLF